MRAAPEMRKPAGQGELREDIQSSNDIDNIAKPLSKQQRWRNRHPVAAWAHSATQSAIRRGIIAPQACSRCGAAEAEAHHPDHRQPLLIEWLCRKCHKAEHRRLRQGGAA